MRMLAALMLLQIVEVRESIELALEVQRFCVLRPSVSTIITLSRSGAVAGALNRPVGASVSQPQASPMVIFVLPVGVIESILALSALQSLITLLNGIKATGHHCD